MAKMTFASVYPHYLAKVESKNRTREKLHQVIEWLTVFDEKKLKALINKKTSFETFFKEAKLNSNAYLITGVICGYRIEEIKQVAINQNPVNEICCILVNNEISFTHSNQPVMNN